MIDHKFGGDWTEEKLDRLRKYLQAYTRIFTRNEQASWYRTTYLDGFAGTLYRQDAALESEEPALFELARDPDTQGYKKGSAVIALETKPEFDRYLFIDQRAEHVQDLEALKDTFPRKASRIEIRQGDANQVLQDWCSRISEKGRALVFLDPYGMQVHWATLEALAATKAVDLWLLFPLGQSVIRLLTHKEPPASWAQALTRTFGTSEWKTKFYKKSAQPEIPGLFGDTSTDSELQRNATLQEVGEFFVERLKSIFVGVPEPLPLRNSKNNPIFLLCFAASNPKGAPTAIKIANHILRH